MGFPELFEKNIGPIHFIRGIYPYGVSLLTPIHFYDPSLIFGPLVAKYLAENGFSGIIEKKTIGSIHFIPGIYPYRVSLLTPIYFHVPSLIFGPPMAKYLAEMRFLELFEKTIGSNSFHTWHLSLWGESQIMGWPLSIFVFLASFSALWWPDIWLKMGFPEFFEKTIGSIYYISGIYP